MYSSVRLLKETLEFHNATCFIQISICGFQIIIFICRIFQTLNFAVVTEFSKHYISVGWASYGYWMIKKDLGDNIMTNFGKLL